MRLQPGSAEAIPGRFNAIVGANIRALRLRNGWSQARLGALMGWPTNATVCAAEGRRGGRQRRFSTGEVFQLAAIFGVPPMAAHHQVRQLPRETAGRVHLPNLRSTSHFHSRGARAVNRDDAQTLRDMTYFTGELLKHADVLPPGLADMLRDYQSELQGSPPGRWDGIGDPVQYERLADRIAQSVTDGEWPEGERMDCHARNRQAWGETRSNFERALRLLAARGEIAMTDGRYYTRTRGERP